MNAVESFVAVATFLLEERRIRASEQSFLLTNRTRARQAPSSFRLSHRQQMWLDTIIDDHRGAIEAAGLDADLDLEQHHDLAPDLNIRRYVEGQLEPINKREDTTDWRFRKSSHGGGAA